MDVKPAQQPTNTTCTGPGQPTDSSTAALPVETLQHILELALEGEDAWRRQSTRLRFGRVCTLWWKVAEVGTELAVNHTSTPERVAKLLKGGKRVRRERVRSLYINVEADSSTGKGKLLAGLVALCPSLEKVEMLVNGSTKLGMNSALSKPLADALSSLTKLQHFTYESQGDFFLPKVADFGALISSWPHLKTLVIPNAHLWPYKTDTKDLVALSEPLPLRRLHLPLGDAPRENIDTINTIISAASNTLRHLDLGMSRRPHLVFSPGFSVSSLSAIASIAPQLHSLTSRTELEGESHPLPSHYLTATLTALRDIRTHHIGLAGYDLATIFTLLQPLPFLRTLSVTTKIAGSFPTSDFEPFRPLEAQATIAFIDQAAALKSLTLPCMMARVWEKEELENVVESGRRRGVAVKLE
ncbi:hypothetical protein BCR35DRAFT_309713 [Leucosporidium creatinivorum]|uniref:F-box domain-containing protein n=1 Tax=Leucosporidium creatinivorum TaxID=106004 RepID=A0A1Y2DDC8_9BASI|nr:hypothetical protein BCR35DRAFT_309713 [Leucosporidium creatinivorum]